MSHPDITHEQVLSHAREVIRQRPAVTRTDLRAILMARFTEGKDPRLEAAPHGGLGVVTNPVDWIRGLSVIFSGIGKLWRPTPDGSGVIDVIEGVIIILT